MSEIIKKTRKPRAIETRKRVSKYGDIPYKEMRAIIMRNQYLKTGKNKSAIILRSNTFDIPIEQFKDCKNMTEINDCMVLNLQNKNLDKECIEKMTLRFCNNPSK